MKQISLALNGIGIVCLALLSGCGSKLPETAPVVGKVTMNGKPVSSGTIMFCPEKGRAATGQIGPDGTYSLTTFKPGDGALLGKHRVTIESVSGTRIQSFQELEKLDREQGGQTPITAVKWLVPKGYSQFDTTPLTAEVAPGKNTLDFNLPAAAR
jgi:hypothetical protein